VTVNPDLFVNRIVDVHGLQTVFDAIVVSSAEGTADKGALCEAALHRLGFDGDRCDALLIDNRQDLIGAWRFTGGAGYWYRSDEALEADWPELLR